MKKFIKYAVPITIFFLLIVVPAVSFALDNGGVVPCDNSAGDPCNWTAFMGLINNVIGFILFKLALPIAAVMMAYAGFLLVTAQGGEAKTKAKNIFTNAVLGLIFAAAAWLIIRTVLSILGYKGGWIGF